MANPIFIRRLTDPQNLVDEKTLLELNDKLGRMMTRLADYPAKGGNPFLFAMSTSNQHVLLSEKDPKTGEETFNTAATDGVTFYWSVDFMKSLTLKSLRTVFEHEIWHNVYFHCDPTRRAARNPIRWNYAVDYVANASIYECATGMDREPFSEMVGGMSKPLSMKDLNDLTMKRGKYAGMSEKKFKDFLKSFQFHLYDPTLQGKNAYEIFDMIEVPPCSHNGKPGEGLGDICPDCQANGMGGFDKHMDSKLTPKEVAKKLREASEVAKAMRGTVPGGVEATLMELEEPELSIQDLLRSTVMSKQAIDGDKKRYGSYRKRYLMLDEDEPYFVSKHADDRAKWICGFDTSGSMSDADIANGLKELKLFGENTEGVVIPMDCTVYWDKAVGVESADDLRNAKVVGRGGTTFADFFKDLPKKMGTEFDVVIVITDGYCDEIPKKYRPEADVVWLITANHKEFKPSFGRVVHLRVAKD